MKWKKTMALLLAGSMTASMMTGCGSSEKPAKPAEQSSAAAQTSGGGTEAPTESVDVEIWGVNNGFLEVKKDSTMYNFYKDLIGVGVTQPYVEWNGGTTYQEQLNLRIAGGDIPDMFMPVKGMETDLAKNGALLDLTDLLPEKAPHLWATVPEEVWDIIRTYDPNGEGRIYMIPSVIDFALMTGLIRQDWLDKLGLDMPTNEKEFVEVLRAFKTQDPNGNGEADEIPTGGRQEARWMDHLFGMYGVAMWEGNPDWDIYDGELTYSGVTPNMKAALQFVSELYAEGLLDPETLLNDKASWNAKLFADKVGMYYHWAQTTYDYAINNFNITGNKPVWKAMPPISADGYEGFYTQRRVKGLSYVVANTKDEAKIDAIMKVLDAYGNQDLWSDFFFGAEGMHHNVVDGKKVIIPVDRKTQENLVLRPYEDMSTIESVTTILDSAKSSETDWAYAQSSENVSHMDEYGKTIAGDGMPNSVYEGYPDIMNRTLYVEYATKIITGEWPIDKFDEFVEKWYASGGEAVTVAAREWYGQLGNN